MDRDDDEFLKVNANADYIAYQLAEMIRNCMRATASQDPTGQTYRAMKNFNAVQRLIGYAGPVKGLDVFEKALSQLRVTCREEDDTDAAILNAAKAGVQMLTDMSCSDDAARSRARKRQYDFVAALERVGAVREHRRQVAAARTDKK
jgi:hypothetical protein